MSSATWTVHSSGPPGQASWDLAVTPNAKNALQMLGGWSSQLLQSPEVQFEHREQSTFRLHYARLLRVSYTYPTVLQIKSELKRNPAGIKVTR